MPRAWRIARERHADALWTGDGARLHGGRWNSPGTPVVYASESRALALLEVLVRLDEAAALEGYVLCEVDIPEDCLEALSDDDLPSDWASHPPPWATQRIGDRWVAEGRGPALRVPSVVVPQEANVVLNPTHPEWTRLTLGEPAPFHLDPRLRRR